MTRKIPPIDEAAERRHAWLAGYSFDELQTWAGRYEALALSMDRLADSELAVREHETSRGRKWSATYHARRDRESAALHAARARIYRELAEITPTCELPGVES